MKRHLIMASLAAATLCSCSGPASQTTNQMIENLDTTRNPRNEFYDYACGGWIAKHPLPAEYARFGSFEEVGELNREQMRSLIEDINSRQHETGSVGQKLKTLFALYMDTTRLDKETISPVLPDLGMVDSITDKNQLPRLIAELHKIDIGIFFGLYIGADDRNSSMNIIHTYQAGLGMDDRDYYISTDDRIVDIRTKYQSHIERMLSIFGYSDDKSKQAAASILKLETRLANKFYRHEELRDPKANYHKMAMSQFQKSFAPFDWGTYFTTLGLHEDSINVSQIRPIQEAVDIIVDTDLDVLKDYIKWHIITSAASYLDSKTYMENFDFFGRTMQGREVPLERWKRAVSLVSGSLGEALGELYVKKYFPEENKVRMRQLVENLRTAYGERIDNLTWMSDTTKAKAHEKLNKLLIKIGYPDSFRDYSKLQIEDDNLWANIKRIRLFGTNRVIEKAGKPVDRSEWHMTPQTVNAYYNPSTNEICFPAGILQRPFFDMAEDDAYNYGAIGVVIGHEMTHGYDDQGRQYDAEGNLHNWWTEDDGKKFDERAQRLCTYFDSIEVAPGLKANGKFTLGENLADYGGLRIAFHAFSNAIKVKPIGDKDGFTAAQRFFLAYAGVWANNIRPEEILRRTKEDPHSLGRWRVDGTLPHVPEWATSFGVTEGDKMYLAPEKQADIW